LIKATRATDVVFHLAAKLHLNNPGPKSESEYNRINVEGTRSLVEAAQINNISRLIFFSTISVYGSGRPDVMLDESSPPFPQTLYAKTKFEAEHIVLGARKKNSNEPLGVVLRLAAVYGHRVKGNYARLVKALRKGWFLPVGSGLNRRTLVHEKDVLSAALLAAEHPRAPGQIYNVTDGKTYTFNEILAAICHALGRRPPRLALPVAPLVSLAGLVGKVCELGGRNSPFGSETIKKLVEDVTVSGKKLQRELGFDPQFDLSAGWKETVHKMFERSDRIADVETCLN
jgi:UDP-glucose 4-epimerase